MINTLNVEINGRRMQIGVIFSIVDILERVKHVLDGLRGILTVVEKANPANHGGCEIKW